MLSTTTTCPSVSGRSGPCISRSWCSRTSGRISPRTLITSPRPAARETIASVGRSDSTMERLGMMYFSDPHITSMPSMMARVSGSTSRNVEPCPCTDETLTRPRMPSMLRLTTSMPTPRPEISVTRAAVEKPGRKISAWTSWSFSSWFSATSPFSRALTRIRSRFRPRPSSVSSTMIEPPSWYAERRSVERAGLPALRRSSVVSTPWSMALRMRWTSGSSIRSTMLRSISVSSPESSRTTSLPVLRERSRTMRAIFWKTARTGTMRMRMATFCRSRLILVSWLR